MFRNRVISALLAVVMTLISGSIVMAAEAEETKSGIYMEDMKILSSLGFLKRFTSDDENAAVTKGAFTAAVMDLLGAKAGTADMKSPFSDVDDTTSFYREICLAAQYGVAHGDETPKFEPDSAVTYRDAAVLLVNALGYHDYAKYEGGYPNGYLKIASDIGLNKNLNVGENTRLTSGMCARLLLNAGNTEVVNVIPSNGSYKVEKGDELFWDKHMIFKDTGIVEANELTSLDSADGVGKNHIQISGMLASIYYSNESYDYMGYNVEYYAKENEGETTVLYMTPKKTEVTVIDSSDIDYFEDDILYYTAGNRSDTLRIPKDIPIIYNGVYTIKYYLEDGTSIFCPENGEIKAIDNNNDGDADVISVLLYENLVVSAVDKTEGMVYDRYDPTFTLDFQTAEENSDSSWIVTDNKGIIVSISDFKVWDVISVAKSFDDRVMRAVVNRTIAVGKLTKRSTDGDDTVIAVNGTEYIVTKKFVDNSKIPEIGSMVTLYLDLTGKVAAIGSSASANNYGFLVRTIVDEATDECMIKIMNSDGAVSIMDCADSVRIDGVTFNKRSYSGDDGQENRNIIKYFTEPEGYNRYKDSANPAGGIFPVTNEEFLEPFQMIVYKTNSEGKITYIDTIRRRADESEDSLHALNAVDKKYYFYNGPMLFGTEGSSVCVDPSGMLFKTPSYEYRNESKDYSMGSFSELVYGTRYEMMAYTTNSESVIPEAVHIQQSAGSGTSMPRNARTCVIKDIQRGLNSDDEEVTFLNYYSGKTEYNDIVSSEVDTSKLKVGDIIKVVFDGKGQISYINHVAAVDLDNNTFGFTSDNQYVQSDFGNEYQPYVTRIFTVDGNVIGVTDTITSSTQYTDCTFHRISENDTAMYIVRFNGRNGKTTVEPISYSDMGAIKDYEHHGNKTPAFLMTTYAVSKFLVVYDCSI